MTPASHDITIRRDRDFSLTLTFKDSDGTVIDLTGYSAKAQVRPTKDSSTLWVTMTATITAEDGEIELTLTDAQTLALDDDYVKGWWDLVLTNPSGLRQSYVEGTATIKGTVTRV